MILKEPIPAKEMKVVVLEATSAALVTDLINRFLSGNPGILVRAISHQFQLTPTGSEVTSVLIVFTEVKAMRGRKVK